MIVLDDSNMHFYPPEWDPEFNLHVQKWTCRCEPYFEAHQHGPDSKIVVVMHQQLDE